MHGFLEESDLVENVVNVGFDRERRNWCFVPLQACAGVWTFNVLAGAALADENDVGHQKRTTMHGSLVVAYVQDAKITVTQCAPGARVEYFKNPRL